ncbi:hypothetical protein TeGR_g10429 [Tetraparma gracilis]|uniref:Carboxylic ester hydrolase n=1 Tax=Tetraparma gracilis TaxID=2962635 RepID=A0ABQ6N5H9_9STRA|nr:hypothetical protein TeGR_g10429 [Tetraparma gracilis]
MSLLLLAVLPLLALSSPPFPPPPLASSPPVVPPTVVLPSTNQTVTGTSSPSVSAFHALPFAAPPTGALRFSPPSPPAPSSAPIDGTERGAICPQFDVRNNLYLGSEDCLTLSVYAPSGAVSSGNGPPSSSAPLPVMVWLFGGGFAVGDGAEFGLYDGTALAESKNAVVVSPNYRVGALGFLASAALPDSGNFGLQDQRRALEWVQANIAAFGGDPDNVMIFGQSAGAISVCAHYANGEASAGLFSAAVMESGTCDSPEFFRAFGDSEAYSKEYAKSVGCEGDGDAYVECLRSLPTKEIIAGVVHGDAAYVPPLAPIMAFVPTISGSASGVPELPLASIKAGRSMAARGVPLALGSNQDEGSIFVPALPVMVPGFRYPFTRGSDVELAVHHILDPVLGADVVGEHFDELMAHYPQSKPSDQMMMILRDYVFLCPSRRAARAVSASGSADAFMYQFHYKNLWADVVELGDYHGVEIYFIFDTYGLPGMELLHPFLVGEKAMVEVMQGYWAGMAKQQRPKYEGGVNWPAYDRQQEQYMELNWPAVVKTDLNGEVCDYHDKMLNLY